MRFSAGLLVIVALLAAHGESAAQSWSWFQDSGETLDVEWIVGAQAPASKLGSFGDYRIWLDPWPALGTSLRAGTRVERFGTRLEALVVPGVAMRRHAPTCDECSPESERLWLVSGRFLGDLSFPLRGESTGYLTGGVVMRIQLGEPEDCPRARGQECALQEFARSRVDPGVMAGIGWRPAAGPVRAIQVSGRMSFYGRGTRPEASPTVLLPDLELSARFAFPR